MEISSKIKRYLNNNIWYHATTLDNWSSIIKNGVLVDFNKDTSDSLDFGYGFYLTHSKDKAENYIKQLLNAGILGEKQPVILGFEFNALEIFGGTSYSSKILNSYDDEFALFVFTNRVENISGSKQHEYDIIFGVMSDSVPTKVIIDYKMGTISKEEALEKLKKPTSMKQLSLHNQSLCDILKLSEAYQLDIVSGNRKELNINEYNGK